jgi:hypothetical protein
MDEFEDEDGNVYRNDYFDEADDGFRNRRGRRRRVIRRVSSASTAMTRRPAPVAAAPAPVVIEERRGIRDMPTGLLIDAIAQALTAFAPLPAAPPKTGVPECDLENIIEYMAASNQYYKRNEQLRTAGALARLFI